MLKSRLSETTNLARCSASKPLRNPSNIMACRSSSQITRYLLESTGGKGIFGTLQTSLKSLDLILSGAYEFINIQFTIREGCVSRLSADCTSILRIHEPSFLRIVRICPITAFPLFVIIGGHTRRSTLGRHSNNVGEKASRCLHR